LELLPSFPFDFTLLPNYLVVPMLICIGDWAAILGNGGVATGQAQVLIQLADPYLGKTARRRLLVALNREISSSFHRK